MYKLVQFRPTGRHSWGSLTAVIQNKVVLGIAVLFWSARYEHVIVPEEILQAGDLEGQQVTMLRDHRSQEENQHDLEIWSQLFQSPGQITQLHTLGLTLTYIRLNHICIN